MSRPKIYRKAKRADILTKNISDYGDLLTIDQVAFMTNSGRDTVSRRLNDKSLGLEEVRYNPRGRRYIKKQSLLNILGVNGE